MKPEEKRDDNKQVKTEAQKKLEKDTNTIVRVHENEKKIAAEIKVLTTGSYVDVVKFRWKDYVDGPFDPAGQAFSAIALFS